MVNGAFDVAKNDDCGPVLCPNDCSGKGICSATKGVCECSADHTGPDCSIRARAAFGCFKLLTNTCDWVQNRWG